LNEKFGLKNHFEFFMNLIRLYWLYSTFRSI